MVESAEYLMKATDVARSERDFISLYRAFEHRVHNYIRRRVSSPEVTEELANDVFRIAWQKQGKGAEPSTGWLLSVAHHVIGNEYRGRARRQELLLKLMDNVDASCHTQESTEQENLAQALARLNIRSQEVILLSYWEDLSLAEIGRVLGCSESAAGVRLFRARIKLRKLLSIPTEREGES